MRITRHRRSANVFLSTFLILSLLTISHPAYGAEQLHITFDPPLEPGWVKPMDNWVEQGMFFTGPQGFTQYDSGRSGCPDNGTAYLHFASGPQQTLTFSFVDSTPFTLISVDLAEYSTLFAKPKTITLVCHKTDGTVETANFTVDGLIDGPGGISDFETFAFGPEFTEISYVEVPTTGYSMDNVVLAQLPGYETLIGLEITGPNNVEETTSAQYNAIAFFEGGNTLNVNSSTSWSLDSNMYASIEENGLLTVEDIDLPEDITIYAQYSKDQATMEAQISVHLSLHTPLIMHVPADYDTIQAAIDRSIISDIIIVQPGFYYENINFGGKNITLRSTDPTKPDIVADTIIDGAFSGSVVTFSGEESADCLLSGFTITNGSGNPVVGGGICGYGTLATIEYNVISNNRVNPSWFPSSAFGGGLFDCDGTIQYNIISDNGVYCDEGGALGGGLYGCDGMIRNNIIISNEAAGFGTYMGGGFYSCNGYILNNTIVGNSASYGGAFGNCTATIENCIIWANSPDDMFNSSLPTFSCIQGSSSGIGNIDIDPYFVDAAGGDYHLISNGWRWDVGANDWTYDDVTSECIDAGNPGSALGNEPMTLPVDSTNRWGRNYRINMGAYGGTAEASMPPPDWYNIADMTNDKAVDIEDLLIFAGIWLDTYLDTGPDLPADLNRDKAVNLQDFSILCENWLW